MGIAHAPAATAPSSSPATDDSAPSTAASVAPVTAVDTAITADVIEFKNPMHKEIVPGAEVKKGEIAPAATTLKPPRMDWARLWSYLRKDKYWVFMGFTFAAASGCLLPGFSLLLATVFDVFFNPNNVELELKAREYLYLFLGIGAIAWLVQVGQAYSFAVFGERFIRRLRGQAFSAVLRQEIGYYDLKENAVGAITARLGTDASQLRMVVGARLSEKFGAIATAIMGIVIAFVASWQLSLIVLVIAPAFLFCKLAA
jgi:ATP-binding cassette subfamily B (MDR/TAP) protein 1